MVQRLIAEGAYRDRFGKVVRPSATPIEDGRYIYEPKGSDLTPPGNVVGPGGKKPPLYLQPDGTWGPSRPVRGDVEGHRPIEPTPESAAAIAAREAAAKAAEVPRDDVLKVPSDPHVREELTDLEAIAEHTNIGNEVTKVESPDHNVANLLTEGSDNVNGGIHRKVDETPVEASEELQKEWYNGLSLDPKSMDADDLELILEEMIDMSSQPHLWTPDIVMATGRRLRSMSDRINYHWYVLTGMRGRELGRIYISDLTEPGNRFFNANGTGISETPQIKLRNVRDDKVTYRQITPKAAQWLHDYVFGLEDAATTVRRVSEGAWGAEHDQLLYSKMPRRAQLVGETMEKEGTVLTRASVANPRQTDAVFLNSRWQEITYKGSGGASTYISNLSKRIGEAAFAEGAMFTRGSIRDFFATQAIINGWEAHTVALLIGHSPNSSLKNLSHYLATGASVLMARLGHHMYSPIDKGFKEEVAKLLDGGADPHGLLVDGRMEREIRGRSSRGPRKTALENLMETYNLRVQAIMDIRLKNWKGITTPDEKNVRAAEKRYNKLIKEHDSLVAQAKKYPEGSELRIGFQTQAENMYEVIASSKKKWLDGQKLYDEAKEFIESGGKRGSGPIVNDSPTMRMNITKDTKNAVRAGRDLAFHELNLAEADLQWFIYGRAPREVVEFLETPSLADDAVRLPDGAAIGERAAGHVRYEGGSWSDIHKDLYTHMWEIEGALRAVHAFIGRADILGRVRPVGAGGELLTDAEWTLYKNLFPDAKNRALLNAQNLHRKVLDEYGALESKYQEWYNAVKGTPAAGGPVSDKLLTIKKAIDLDKNTVMKAFENPAGHKGTKGTNLKNILKNLTDHIDVKALGLRAIVRYQDGSIKPQLLTPTLATETGIQVGDQYMLVAAFESVAADGQAWIQYKLRKVSRYERDPVTWEANSMVRLTRLYADDAEMLLDPQDPSKLAARSEHYVWGKPDEPVPGWFSVGEVDKTRIIHPGPAGPAVWEPVKVGRLLYQNYQVGWKGKKGAYTLGTDDRKIMDQGFNPPGVGEKQFQDIANHTKRLQRLMRGTASAKGGISERGLWKKFTEGDNPLLVKDWDGQFKFNPDVVREFNEARRRAVATAAAAFKNKEKNLKGINKFRKLFDGHIAGAGDAGDIVPPRPPTKSYDSLPDPDGKRNRIPKDENGNNKLGNDPTHVKEFGGDFLDSKVRQMSTNRMNHHVRVPFEWVFGQNFGRTAIKKLVGSHRLARMAAKAEGAAVMATFRNMGEVFGYSAKNGRSMNVQLADNPQGLAEFYPPQARRYLGRHRVAGEGPGQLRLENKDLAPGMTAVRWEAIRIQNILETPESMLGMYYKLNDEQLELYHWYHEAIARLQDMSARSGYDLEDYVKGMMIPNYVPRLIDRATDAARAATIERTPVLGSDPVFFRAREYGEMGLTEDLMGPNTFIGDPVETLRQLYEGTYGWVADRQFTALLKPFGKSLRHHIEPVSLGFSILKHMEHGIMIPQELHANAATHYGNDILDLMQRVIQTKSGIATVYPDVLNADELADAIKRINDKVIEVQSIETRKLRHEAALRNPRGIEAFITGNKDIVDLAFEPDVMKELKDYVKNMEETAFVKGPMRVPALFSSYVRTLSTTFDLGTPLIHGFMLMVMTPTLAAQKGIAARKAGAGVAESVFEGLSWHKTPWAHAVKEMYGALISKNSAGVRLAFHDANAGTIREMERWGTHLSKSQLEEITGSAIRSLSEREYLGPLKLGYKGWTVASATRRAETTFNIFLDVAKVEYWKAMRPFCRTNDDLRELAAAVNKVTGGLDPVRAGITEHQRVIESTYLMFAPMLRRATAALVWKAAEGTSILASKPFARALGKEITVGMERRQAMKAVGSLMAVAGALGAMVYYSGNNKKVFDSESADFMSAKIGGSRVGLGTPFYALARMGSGVFHQLKGDPEGKGKFEIQDFALLKWMRSSASPVGSSVIDIINGRNFIGDPLRDADGSWEKLNIMRYLGRQAFPFWVESLVYDFQGWNKATTLGEIMGLRTSPLPKSQQLRQLRELYLSTDMNDPELVEWRNEQTAAGQPISVDYAPVMIIDRLEARHEDIVEIRESMGQSKFFQGDKEQRNFKDFTAATEDNRKEHQKRLLGIENDFNMGLIDHRAFRKRIQESNAELRGAHHAVGQEYKDTIDLLDERRTDRLEVGDGYLGDLAYDDFRTSVTGSPEIHDEYGNFIPENYQTLVDDWKQRNSEQLWDYVQKRMKSNKELPPTMVELEKARVELKPFWELSKKIFGEDSAEYDLITEWYGQKTLESQTIFRRMNPRINSLLKIMSKAKDFWRKMHPKQDKHLVRFYGYSPIFGKRY